MTMLRDADNGCPWDKKQSFATIVPHTLEEVYEVVDAIERNDLAHLPNELGDLLFQVVFYAQLGKEAGLFDFDDIVNELAGKLLTRHPHVFPDATIVTPADDARLSAPTPVTGIAFSPTLVGWSLDYRLKPAAGAVETSWTAFAAGNSISGLPEIGATPAAPAASRPA